MRDANGEKYNVEEKLSVRQEENADLVYRYVRDEATGRSYKKLVLWDNPEKELVLLLPLILVLLRLLCKMKSKVKFLVLCLMQGTVQSVGQVKSLVIK